MIQLTNFIQSNKWGFIGLILFFIGGWFFDRHFNQDNFGEINSNLALTVAQTKGFSHAATTCHIVYEYKVDGSLYRGQ